MKKVIENRNHLAEKQQIINTSVILRDFLQEKGVAASDIYRFLKGKKFTVIQLEKAKNEFINFSMYNRETELVKEFFVGLEV